jgi:hypothetical protein
VTPSSLSENKPTEPWMDSFRFECVSSFLTNHALHRRRTKRHAVSTSILSISRSSYSWPDCCRSSSPGRFHSRASLDASSLHAGTEVQHGAHLPPLHIKHAYLSSPFCEISYLPASPGPLVIFIGGIGSIWVLSEIYKIILL